MKPMTADIIFLAIMLIFITATIIHFHEQAHATHCRYFGGAPSIKWMPPTTRCANLSAEKSIYFWSAASELESISYMTIIIAILLFMIFTAIVSLRW